MRNCMARYPPNPPWMQSRFGTIRLGYGPLAPRPRDAEDADQRPKHPDDNRRVVPLEEQRDENQDLADQVEQRKTPILGRQPALLIREIFRDEDGRAVKPDDVVWLDIAPHRRLPAAAANPVQIPFGRDLAARHNRRRYSSGRRGSSGDAKRIELRGIAFSLVHYGRLGDGGGARREIGRASCR